MFFNFFTKKEKKEYSFNRFSLYSVGSNGREISKLSSIDTISKEKLYIILQKIKTLSHPNIAPIERITSHSVFTKKLFPFSYEKFLSKEYKIYFYCKIKKALQFLHEEGKIYSRVISKDYLFIDESGNPMFACYFDMENITGTETLSDIVCLDKIFREENLGSLENLEVPEIFTILEKGIAELGEMSLDQKKHFMLTLKKNKHVFNTHIVENIFFRFIDELNSTSIPKEYKIHILQFLLTFNTKMFHSKYFVLFKVIDSEVRRFVLANIHIQDSLDSSLEDIALGLRADDKDLNLETLKFIFKNKTFFKDKSRTRLVDTMRRQIKNTEAISYICQYFTTNNFTSYINIYKLLIAFLNHKKATHDVYNCIEKYYVHFNKYNMCSELLPVLCSRLSDKECQDQCFLIVENIVKFLKKNKTLLENKDWGISRVKRIFKKSNSDQAIQDKIKQITQKLEDSEWEEQDL